MYKPEIQEREADFPGPGHRHPVLVMHQGGHGKAFQIRDLAHHQIARAESDVDREAAVLSERAPADVKAPGSQDARQIAPGFTKAKLRDDVAAAQELSQRPQRLGKAAAPDQ